MDWRSRHGRGLRGATALLLPGTARLHARRPTWTQVWDPVRARRFCGWVCGRPVVRYWCRSVRGVMRGEGAWGARTRAPRHAPARSGREAGSRRGGRGGQLSAPRHGHVGRWAGFRPSASHHGTIVVTCLVGLRTSGGCLAESQCGPEPACELTRTAWPRGDLVLLVILARPRLVKHGHTLVRVFQIFFSRFSKAVGDTQTPHHLNCFSNMCLYQYDARLR